MRRDFFLLADSATIAEQGKINMRGAGIGHVVLPSVPGRISSLAAVGRFIIEDADHGRTHMFSTRMTAPSGEEIVRLDHEFTVEPPPVTHAGELQGIVFVVTFPEPSFAEYGVYVVTFYINDEPAADAGLVVEAKHDTQRLPSR